MRRQLDYKFFCFGGHVKMVQVDLDRFGSPCAQSLYPGFYCIPGELNYPAGYEVARPAAFDAAVEIAERLSREIDFVRVDLYLVEKDVYFGEMTCFPGSGCEEFRPRQMDHDLGKMLSAVAMRPAYSLRLVADIDPDVC